jgi:hypothetical protein
MALAVYKPRDPRKSPLFRLLESSYETVKGIWEERFESRYGFWQGRWDEVVAGYLDCGDWLGGFARVRCPTCAEEFLCAFSCKQRGLCPSCGAKRGAELAAFVADEVVVEVGHAQWVFTVPKMLRFFFFRRRELLGEMSRLAYETVRELMAAAAGEKSLAPGMVTVIQTFGERVNPHPHLHAVVSRGGWTASGEWIGIPYVDGKMAERLFRHKVLRLLRREDLLSQERVELLLSWKHSGFSVHNQVRLAEEGDPVHHRAHDDPSDRGPPEGQGPGGARTASHHGPGLGPRVSVVPPSAGWVGARDPWPPAVAGLWQGVPDSRHSKGQRGEHAQRPSSASKTPWLHW